MTVVSDTGPLIALAKANQLHLLEQLFVQVLIPPAVHREVLAKSGPEAARLDAALDRFVTIVRVPELPPEVKVITSRLGDGEKQAIALAFVRGSPLVIDDRLGRLAARHLHLSTTGTVGILIRAKETALIPAVLPVLTEIRQQGYWLSDDLIAVAAALAGEA